MPIAQVRLLGESKNWVCKFLYGPPNNANVSLILFDFQIVKVTSLVSDGLLLQYVMKLYKILIGSFLLVPTKFGHFSSGSSRFRCWSAGW